MSLGISFRRCARRSTYGYFIAGCDVWFTTYREAETALIEALADLAIA